MGGGVEGSGEKKAQPFLSFRFSLSSLVFPPRRACPPPYGFCFGFTCLQNSVSVFFLNLRHSSSIIDWGAEAPCGGGRGQVERGGERVLFSSSFFSSLSLSLASLLTNVIAAASERERASVRFPLRDSLFVPASLFFYFRRPQALHHYLFYKYAWRRRRRRAEEGARARPPMVHRTKGRRHRTRTKP